MIFELLGMPPISGCIFREFFQIYCPGCGGTRALKALLQLNPLQSLYYNPVVICLVIDILCILGVNLLEMQEACKEKYYKARIFVHVIFLIIWFAYFVIRNYLLVCWGIDMLGDFSH